MRLLTDEEIVAHATEDSEYCQLAVDVGGWAAELEHERVLKAVGEWLERRTTVVGGFLGPYTSCHATRYDIEALQEGRMPE